MPTYSHILRKRIPQGGFGRPLTSTERRELRALGMSCSNKCIVVQAHGDPYSGIVYNPCPTGGYSHAGIYVCCPS